MKKSEGGKKKAIWTEAFEAALMFKSAHNWKVNFKKNSQLLQSIV